MAHSIDIQDLMNQAISAYVEQDFSASADMLTRVLTVAPDHVLARISRGATRLKLNQADGAIRDFDKVIETAPHHARAWHLRGLAKAQRGDDAGARSDFDRAIDIDPDYGAAYLSRANLGERTGDVDQAGKDMQMVGQITQHRLESFNQNHNVWQSQHLSVESAIETELNR